MTDIVERLHRLASKDWAPRHDTTLTEAAAEIERLRRLVGDMLHAQHRQERTNILQEAEIERLRAEVKHQRNRIASLKDLIEDEEEAERQ